MIPLVFAVLLIVLAWRMGAAFDKRRELPLVSGHYVWPGRFVVDRVLTDAGPSAQAQQAASPRLEEVGEGAV